MLGFFLLMNYIRKFLIQWFLFSLAGQSQKEVLKTCSRLKKSVAKETRTKKSFEKKHAKTKKKKCALRAHSKVDTLLTHLIPKIFSRANAHTIR